MTQVTMSDTSLDAYHSILFALGERQRYVYDAIRAAGERGLTCDELEESTGDSHQSISPRFGELERKGAIQKFEKRPTRSGKEAWAYRCKEAKVIEELDISDISRDGTQTRESLHEDTVVEYSERMTAGDEFPPLTVFADGERYWLADGFHRIEARQRAGFTSVFCAIHEGSKRDAVLFGLTANCTHGLRRTNADKRRAVMILLEDAEWSKKSDRWIALKAGVSNRLVSNLRPAVNGSHLDMPTARIGQDGKQYPASNSKRLDELAKQINHHHGKVEECLETIGVSADEFEQVVDKNLPAPKPKPDPTKGEHAIQNVVTHFEKLNPKTKDAVLRRLRLDDDVMKKSLKDQARGGMKASEEVVSLLTTASDALHGFLQQYGSGKSTAVFSKASAEDRQQIVVAFDRIGAQLAEIEKVLRNKEVIQ